MTIGHQNAAAIKLGFRDKRGGADARPVVKALLLNMSPPLIGTRQTALLPLHASSRHWRAGKIASATPKPREILEIHFTRFYQRRPQARTVLTNAVRGARRMAA